MDDTDNLLDEADSLLSRYRRPPTFPGRVSAEADQCDFPVLTETVGDFSGGRLDEQAAPPRSVLEANEPYARRPVADEIVEQLADSIGRQLANRLSILISERMDTLSSELIAEVHRISSEALQGVIKDNNTLSSFLGSHSDDRKE